MIGRIAATALVAVGLTACASTPGSTRTYSGEVRAGERWTTAFEVSGVLQEHAAAVGEDVEAGRVLARLAPEPFDARLEKAETALRSAQARWTRVTEEIDPEQLRVYSPSITTSLDLGPMRIAVLEAEMGLGTADTELRHARWASAAAEVVAPRAGRVARWFVPEGATLEAGVPVALMEDATATEVVVRVPSEVAAGLRRGQRAEVVQEVGKHRFHAAVRRIGATAKPAADVEVILDITERAQPGRGAVGVLFDPG